MPGARSVGEVAMADVRMTARTRRVLDAVLAQPMRGMTAREIARSAGVPGGAAHPILARLEGVGWVESRWTDADPREPVRPPRRAYTVTAKGAVAARSALAAAARPSTLRPATSSEE